MLLGRYQAGLDGLNVMASTRTARRGLQILLRGLFLVFQHIYDSINRPRQAMANTDVHYDWHGQGLKPFSGTQALFNK